MISVLRIVLRLAGAALVTGLIGAAMAGDGAKSVDPDIGDRIATAVAFDGQLWLVGGTRRAPQPDWALVSYNLTTGARERAYSNGVAGLLPSGGRLWVLRRTTGDTYALEERVGNGFTERAKFRASKQNPPITLAAIAGRPAVLQIRSLRIWDGQNWIEQRLTPDQDAAPLWGLASAAGPSDGSALYIGFNRGEWGGGMVRLDIKTGQIDAIESNAPAASGFAGSGKLLNSALDPVNAIIADPNRPSCVLAAIGLVHFESAGRILRVCGSEVSLVFEKLHHYQYGDRDMSASEAFFGLYPSGDGYWAISNGGIYKFGKTDVPDLIALPKLETWNGLHLSRAVPGLIVMTTDVNWAMSLSGYTPIIVPAEPSPKQ
jgi:hypothetical protein